MLVAFDCETALIRPGLLAPPLVCGAFAYQDSVPLLLNARDTCDHLRAELALGATVVGHNIAYDLAVCAAYDGTLVVEIFAAFDRGQFRDTMIREMLMRIYHGAFSLGPGQFSLKSLAKKHLEIDLDKTTYRTGYGPLAAVVIDQWPAGARDYAIKDAEVTRDLYLAQAVSVPDYIDAAETHAVRTEIANTRAAFALHLASAWGVRTDKQAIDALEKNLRAEIAEHEKLLKTGGILRKDGTRDISALRTRAGEAGVTELTASGKIAADAETLRESNDPVLRACADYAATQKLLTTYVPLLRKAERVPLNARYNILVESGRTSCSPNLQNPPRAHGVRECFVPRAGFVFCSVDYDTIELRALADFCAGRFEVCKMAEAIRAGRDLHLELGAKILGVSYEEAEAEKKTPRIKHARQMAKAANFGFPGGMGAARFVDAAKAYGVALDEKKAQKLRDEWFKTWPEMQPFFAYVSAFVEAGNPVETPGSGMLRDAVSFPQACNQHFQGPVAYGAKLALYALARECYTNTGSPLYGSRPVIFVHDEIISEVPEATAHEAAHEMARIMCAEMSKVITRVPVTASPALMSRWSKAAETSYAGGRLVLSC